MIHPSAIIDSGAQIADDCEIGPFSVIGPDVVIGRHCKIASHVVINGPTTIGSNNTIFQFSSVGEGPQDLKYSGEPTQLQIGDDNIIREYATIHRGTVGGGGLTKVGSGNLLMAYSHIAHDCIVGDNVILSNAASIAGHVVIGNQVILGGFTCVHQFTHIADHAFTGLGTVVNRDIPPYVVAAGNHARAVSINKKGLQRRGFSNDTIAALHKTFRLLIKSRLERNHALEQLQPLSEKFPEVRAFIEFVQSSERSVVR